MSPEWAHCYDRTIYVWNLELIENSKWNVEVYDIYLYFFLFFFGKINSNKQE